MGGNPGLLGGNALRSAVVMIEVALSFVLLVGSGLDVAQFLHLQHTNPGFDANRLLTFELDGNDGGAQKPEERAVGVRKVEDRLRVIPGSGGRP